MKTLPPFDGRLYDELGKLMELPDGASYKEFAIKLRRLYTDFETQNRVLVRLEREQFDKDYPALTEYLSGLTDEEKRTFLFTGGLQPILPLEERTKKPWDEKPYEGDAEWYRDDLHSGIYTSCDPEDVPSLAAEWLEELARVGYRGVV